MTDFFYRFRSTDALLEQFHELENQEIYFASSKELNDPLEGFKNLFWSGDEILWANLLSHYLLCLMHTVMRAMLSSPEHPFVEDGGVVYSTPQSLPTPQLLQLHRRICDIFFQHEDIVPLPALLSTRSSPIRRNELTTYLSFCHFHALHAVFIAMEELHLVPRQPNDHFLRTVSIRPISLKSLVELLNASELAHPDLPDIAEDVSTVTGATRMQLDLVNEYNGTWLKGGPAWQTIVSEFPTRHVDKLEQLLYADWYTACFVECPMQAAMWGNYGNEHKGVCLKFKAHPNASGKPAIKLRQIGGWHSDDNGSAPSYQYVEQEFFKVEYKSRFIDMDFFRSMGRLSRPMLDCWYKDAAGNISPCVSDVPTDPAKWREQYWGDFTRAITTKLTDWAQENEYRLTISSWLFDFREVSSRKLRYHFADLQGLIFGMKTSTEDKLKIIRIIEGKCREAGRDDFEFHQAYFSPSTGKIEMAKMNLLKLS